MQASIVCHESEDVGNAVVVLEDVSLGFWPASRWRVRVPSQDRQSGPTTVAGPKTLAPPAVGPAVELDTTPRTALFLLPPFRPPNQPHHAMANDSTSSPATLPSPGSLPSAPSVTGAVPPPPPGLAGAGALPELPTLVDLPAAAPVRRIFTQDDIIPFTQSEPFEWIERFIQRLARAVDGKTVEDDCELSEVSAHHQPPREATRKRLIVLTSYGCRL